MTADPSRRPWPVELPADLLRESHLATSTEDDAGNILYKEHRQWPPSPVILHDLF